MKNQHNYLEDLQEIRNIMNRSSRFISLSGLSGVITGILALIAALLAHWLVFSEGYPQNSTTGISTEKLWLLVSIAVAVLLLSLALVVGLTVRKARKQKQPVWDLQSKRLLINLFIPLATGGLLCLILLKQGLLPMVAPLTLIFYGLALVNASKYTLSEVRSLGLLEIALGLISAFFTGYGLYFWAMGFGLLHIVYGGYMHKKHGS